MSWHEFHTSPRRNSGFSLLEVLVAVTVLGISLTGLIGLVRVQSRSLSSLRCHGEARVILQGAAARFQLGDGVAEPREIEGQFSTYSLDARTSVDGEFGDTNGANLLENSISGLVGDVPIPMQPAEIPQMEQGRFIVTWTERGRSLSLQLDSWRLVTEDPSKDPAQEGFDPYSDGPAGGGPGL